MVTASELADIRAAAIGFLPDTATVMRRTLTDDGVGGTTVSYTSAGTVNCRLVFSGSKSEPTMKDREEGGRITAQQFYLVTLAHDADIVQTDRLAINGDTFELLSDVTARSSEVSKRLLARKL
jgi:hypothetical protein